MAAVPAQIPIQVINVDLALERQKILRGKIRDLFKVINQKSKTVRKELVYTVNSEDMALEPVLRSNPEADALFTAFSYDVITSDAFKDEVMADRPVEDMTIDPQLRYPVIAAFRKLSDRGVFRHRQLVLVGDLYEKIGQVLKSHIPLEVSIFTSKDRQEVSQYIRIPRIEKISPSLDGADPQSDQISLGQISSVKIAGIEFRSVVNMPEVENRFELKDQSIIDTTRKLYSMEGLKQVLFREFVQEEKLTFVRGKKVFIVLEEDLEHVISERLVFDKMQRIYRHHTLEEAEHTLSTGKSQGIVDYFESNGYDIVFDQLSQDERDQFLLAVLGKRLGEFLDKELKTQKAHIGALDDGELQKIFYNVPESVIGQVLNGLKSKSYERYLALVPVKIRESVILDFLSKPQYAGAAWGAVGEEEKKEILTSQAPVVLAHINLVDSKLFKTKFSGIKFEFDRNYDSASLKTMSKEEREATFSLFRKSLERVKIPQSAIEKQLTPEQVARFMGGYINAHQEEFYNRLNPLVRKQLWVTVGKQYRDHIDDTLHFLDKVEIIKGNKETGLDLLFTNTAFLNFLKKGEKPELTNSLFLALKRTNKGESKNALLKKVLTSPDWKANRVAGVPRMLSQPENYPIYQKLSDKVEGLEFLFDSLICTRAVHEQLKDRDPLKNATVTIIDDLVDSNLVNLFHKGYVSKDDYQEFNASVEKEIDKLRGKLSEREAEDPLGVYILESMQILNDMAVQAMSGELERGKIEEIDNRRQVRQRLEDGLKAHLEKIEDFLEKGGRQLEGLGTKTQQAEKMVAMQAKITDEAMQKARQIMGEMAKLQQAQAKANADKKMVALTQKQLSLKFFEIVQPLLLEQIKRFPAFVENLLDRFRSKVHVPESMARRVIFKFTDDEIERIMRYKVVFATKDDILLQFIVTCLHIDNLEDTLFSMAKAEGVPRDTDILFYGPGYTPEDFEGKVKERRMVAFADEAFYKRLLANERLKGQTKTVLTKTAKEMSVRKGQVDAASKDVQAKQAKLQQIESTSNSLTEQRNKLEQRIQNQREKQHHFQGELELLETKFEEVDSRFDEIKRKVDEAMAGSEGDTISLLADGNNGLGENLRDDLVALNKELARMMYIKGVKDAGNTISKSTQNGILDKMEAQEIYDFAKRPFKKLIVADDGSILGRNIKRNFINVASQYFRLSETVMEDVSIKRLNGRVEDTKSEDYPFVVIAADRGDDKYAELRRIVRKVRNRMPETYQLIFTPMGQVWKLDHASDEFQNIRSVKENGALINASIADYTNPPALKQLLEEKVPLN